MKKVLKQIVNWFMVRYTVARINLKDGDVLVFKDKGENPIPCDWSFLSEMERFLKENNFKNVFALYLSKDSELQSMPEEEMNRAGWFRGNQQLLEAYRTKRKYDGYFGRGHDLSKHYNAEKEIERLEGEAVKWPRE